MAASEQMKQLKEKKETIEGEIAELGDVLDSQKGVGMDGPLIDAEGYPRADIDVYTVRHARHKIACLQTDHKLVMKEIETELYRIHAEIRQQQDLSSGVTDMEVGPGSASSLVQATPFVQVNRVDAGSPAADAGLEVDDELLEFGSITSTNYISLKQIGELVQHSIGRPVRVELLRLGETVVLSLTPGPWSGPGNLGCNIIAIKR